MPTAEIQAGFARPDSGGRGCPHMHTLVRASTVDDSYPLYSSANPQEEEVVQKHIGDEGALSDGLCLDGNGSALQELSGFAVGSGKPGLSNQFVKTNHGSSGGICTSADGQNKLFALGVDLNIGKAHVY